VRPATGSTPVSRTGLAGPVYYVDTDTHRLVAFYTDSPDFHTTTGIEPGMAQNAADRFVHRTPYGPWNAIGQASPRANLILPSSCRRPGRCGGKVLALMLESKQNPIGLLFT